MDNKDLNNKENKSIKKKIIVIGIVTVVILLLASTLALYKWVNPSNQNIDVELSLNGLDAYIRYNKGTDVLTGNLEPSSDYTNGISTEIELWKDPSAASKTLYGHIYLDVTTIGTNLANEPALKWAITSNGELLNEGNFVGKAQGNSIGLKLNIPLSTTKQLYKVYIWLDDSMNINENIEGETLSTIVRAEATEVEVTSSTGADYIESLLESNPETMNNDDPNHNVRYMGADPNNYVNFNNELWRIIGVFNVKSSASGQSEKRLKIIKDEPLGNMAWDTADSNDWTKASLNTYLNGEYYNSLNAESKELVGDTYWNIGGSSTYDDVTASMFYDRERGTTTYGDQPSTWIGKIGLMYPSDYGYATSGGTTTNRASCLAKELYNWKNSSYSDCKNNDYLYDSSSYQWTITPYSSFSGSVFYVDLSGYVFAGSANDSSDSSASPVLYLNSSIIITGGTGTSTDPYTLG